MISFLGSVLGGDDVNRDATKLAEECHTFIPLQLGQVQVITAGDWGSVFRFPARRALGEFTCEFGVDLSRCS
jgi:hypothetical protein